jgi:CBS domain containing-hemolysin-like protein
VKNYPDGQVVFVDTPGIHKPLHRMNVRMLDVARDAMRDVDVVAYVVDDGQGGFVVSGRADIEDVADRLGVEIEGEGFETVGGYLLSHLGRVPAVGETFEVGGLTVEVLEAERRRIHKVRARRTQAVAQQD